MTAAAPLSVPGIIEMEPPAETLPEDQAGRLLFDSWKDSAPVMRLSLYLNEHNDQEIRLVLRRQCGRPCIQFKPGLRKDQAERWRIAVNVMTLFEEALPDLQYLLEHRMLALKEADKRG